MGRATMAPGASRSRSVQPSKELPCESTLASATMSSSFMISLGCREKAPMGIQRCEPRTWRPTRKTSTSSTIPAT